MLSKRLKIGGNFIEAVQNYLRNRFPNPLQIDFNVFDKLIRKLNDLFIYKKCSRVANVRLLLPCMYEFSSPPPTVFFLQVRTPSEFS